MTLPIKDILATEKSKAWHFGRYGLIVIIKGHEELFFEFNDEEKRDAFMVLLETHLEIMRHRPALDHRTTSPEKREALLLSELEPRRSVVSSPSDSATSPIPTTVGNLPLADSLSDSIPAVMFTSASSTFLTFKPSKSLNFTLLTIGSRGDVQPYIALAKGLMADGHKVKIATHGDFKEWIESVSFLFTIFLCILVLILFNPAWYRIWICRWRSRRVNEDLRRERDVHCSFPERRPPEGEFEKTLYSIGKHTNIHCLVPGMGR